MTQLISFPFRLTTNGVVATQEEGSDENLTELIAVLMLTQPEERELCPLFGMTDPTFSSFDMKELQTKVGMFGPPVQIESVVTDYPQDGVQSVSVSFVPDPVNEGYGVGEDSNNDVINVI